MTGEQSAARTFLPQVVAIEQRQQVPNADVWIMEAQLREQVRNDLVALRVGRGATVERRMDGEDLTRERHW